MSPSGQRSTLSPFADRRVSLPRVPLSELELRVVEEIGRRRGELVELVSTLIGFDTTARAGDEPARQERELQEHLGERLRRAGAAVEIFEPDPAQFAGKPLYPPGMSFAGRPQLVARFPGAGTGRSLLFNGHIDVVSAEPLDRWSSDPFHAEIRDGNLYGRGACDMKGGVSCMVLASEVLAELGIPLLGDLLVATNTDEESSGAGGLALVLHGVEADAGIVTEPTGFDVWVACRGSSYGVVTVPGRPGHAELAQPDWREGGAVNAIEKAQIVLDAIRGLREEWAAREDLRHPRLSVPDIVPTIISAGEWAVTYPADCRITISVLYLPAQTDQDGWGLEVEREVEEWIVRAAAADPWLAENPPRIDWSPSRVMSFEISADEEIVGATLAATEDVGRPGRLSGLDSWYDGATLTRMGGTPSVGYGPPGIDSRGQSTAHAIDEHVPVDGLIACAQGLAVAAMRFCGVATG